MAFFAYVLGWGDVESALYAPGLLPNALVNELVKYWTVENPERLDTCSRGSFVWRRSRSASSMRDFAISLDTVVSSTRLKASSTAECDLPMWLNTSDAVRRLATLALINTIASESHGGSIGYVCVEPRSTRPFGFTATCGVQSDSPFSMSSRIFAADRPMVSASGSMLDMAGVVK